MKLVSGTNHPELAYAIAEQCQMKLAEATVKRFSDKEIFVEIHDNLRGEDVFIIQPTGYPANDALMELLILIDAARRGSAKRVTAVMPYFGYARQDRKTGPRTPITAKLVANILTASGADRVLTLDLHCPQIQGFFDIPLDNLFASPLFYRDIQEKIGEDVVVISPDIGGVSRARHLAKRLHTEIAIIDKRRPAAGQSEVMHVIGDVKGRHCIIVDDIIDSGGTICHAAQALKEHGAKAVSTYVTHGVLSKGLDSLDSKVVDEFVLTDSIAQTQEILNNPKVRMISVAPLLGEAIQHIATNQSVSVLFD